MISTHSLRPSNKRPERSKAANRTLIYVPIVHTKTDLGSLSEPLREATVKKIGRTGFRLKTTKIDNFWTTVEEAIDNLDVHHEGLKLYQDGLPVCNKEKDIISDLAARGSRNHRLLVRLIDKGAIIMGTESPALLLEEYALTKDMITSSNTSNAASIVRQNADRSESLLQKRDHFIADRINETLGVNETGLIFLGMLHSLGHHLATDIQVIYPIGRPLRS